MMQTHFEAVEKLLRAQSDVAKNTGHSLHKGTPRENFISNFLMDHLPQPLGIGSGEAINAFSKPGDARNQLDVVLYDRTYPKLSISSGVVDVFLIDSIVACLEVKSSLGKKDDVEQPIKAAHNLKSLAAYHREKSYRPVDLRYYVVIYDAPAKAETVLSNYREKLLDLKQDTGEAIPDRTVDGFFALGKWYLLADNSPLTSTGGQGNWMIQNGEGAALARLFLELVSTLQVRSKGRATLSPYVEDWNWESTFVR